MGQAPVEIIREMFAARESGASPMDLLERYLDPDVEWLDSIVTKSTVRGHSGFIHAMENLAREGYEASSVPEEYEELSEGVVLARGYTRLTHGTSFTDLPAFWAFELRDGKIVRGGSATRRDEALAAIDGSD